MLCKVMWDNSVNGITKSVNLTSKSYNFTGTLAIEMYLGKRDAYSILNSLQSH